MVPLNDEKSGDRLELMWGQQLKFMKLLQEKRNFPEFPVDIASKPGQKVIKDIAHDCMHELFEAIHLLKNSKNHRATNINDFDKDAFLEELGDVLHFYIEVCALAGISSEELYEAFMKKGDVNTTRINSNY